MATVDIAPRNNNDFMNGQSQLKQNDLYLTQKHSKR